MTFLPFSHKKVKKRMDLRILRTETQESVNVRSFVEKKNRAKILRAFCRRQNAYFLAKTHRCVHFKTKKSDI